MRLLILLILALMIMGCVSEKPSLPSSTSINTTILKVNDTYTLYIIFTLPNPCHKVSYKGMKAYGNEIDVYFEYQPPKPNEICIQKLEVYKWDVSLGKLVEGEYKIKIYVNDKIIKEFKFYVKE
ncbi:hypothetical protein [Archaeoglobus profundus]|uniref:Lipoprotein n=1 Tax=Archaeoglobus profundus (strain DSM 5631 / JCM 9629 / NBRC 100127 / Av18) TaxID=572546 RepID=D2RDF2_ARCPA|nr:hypothetical protein [Archaeoglobus profundus]ADB58146.1 hypothetical protein Arcpr_1087 [Archaeoglobus profundus DSM 5631]